VAEKDCQHGYAVVKGRRDIKPESEGGGLHGVLAATRRVCVITSCESPSRGDHTPGKKAQESSLIARPQSRSTQFGSPPQLVTSEPVGIFGNSGSKPIHIQSHSSYHSLSSQQEVNVFWSFTLPCSTG
jgi:hypothetical protein